MNKTAIVIALIAAALAATWMWLWYNKDRYQYVHYTYGPKGYPKSLVVDRNTGTVYDGESKIDYPAAKTMNRKFDIRNEQ